MSAADLGPTPSTPRSLGGELNQSRRCASGDHGNCRGQWTAYPDKGGPCECECHPQNVPAPPAGTTASTPPPEGARTGAAGQAPPVAEPGRSTSDLRNDFPLHSIGLPCDCHACVAELRAEKRAELAHTDVGHAALALVIPGLFAAGLLLIAGVSGKLGYLWAHLPLTEHPNGFTLFCLLVLVAVCWRRIAVRRRAHTYRLQVAEALGYDVDQVRLDEPDVEVGKLVADCYGPRWDKRHATDADVTP